MRPWIWKTVLLLGLLSLIFFLMTRPSGRPAKRTDSTSTLRVVAVNLYHLNTQSEAVSQRLAELDPDLVVGLEWTGHNLELEILRSVSLTPVLSEPRPGTHGLLVLAKPELHGQAALMPAPIPGPCEIPLATVRFQYHGQVFSLLGIHVPPPVSACQETTTPTIEAISSWVSQGRLRQDVGIARQGDRVILAGDFNALPWSGALSQLATKGLTDAYASTHWRPGPTWSPLDWLPALLRLDYIWVPTNLRVRQAWVMEVPGSDHRLVMAEIE